MMDDALRRIADALDRLAPPAARQPATDAAAYVWRDGAIAPTHFAPLALDMLTGIDDQKAVVVANVTRHAMGFGAHDMLLWGARGSGKSALVKAAVDAVRGEGHPLALIELTSAALGELPKLFSLVEAWPQRLVVFIDDIGFDEGMADARILRSVLDGGSAARPANVRLAVTSNRRHIVERDMAALDAAVNPRDAADDQLALADRFGLSIGFHVADKPTYLAMVEAYVRAWNLPFDPADAVLFATQRGSRSGRVAWHYVVELAGREGRSIG